MTFTFLFSSIILMLIQPAIPSPSALNLWHIFSLSFYLLQCSLNLNYAFLKYQPTPTLDHLQYFWF